jgi:hypothetical protein
VSLLGITVSFFDDSGKPLPLLALIDGRAP